VYTRISAGTGSVVRFQSSERRSTGSAASATIATRSTSLPTPQSPRAYEPKYPRRWSEGSPFGVAVGVPRRYVEIVQYLCFLDQVRDVLQAGSFRTRQFLEKAGDHVSPGFLSEREMERLDGHLGRLLRGKAGPLMASLGLRGLRLPQVPLGLGKPVTRSIRQGRPPSRQCNPSKRFTL